MMRIYASLPCLCLLGVANCFAQLPAPTITPNQADSITGALFHSLGDYVFPETANKLQACVREHDAEYRAISDPKALANRLTEDLRAVGHDHHREVTFGEQLGIQKDPSPEEKQRAHAFDFAHGYGIRSARRLPGNIGYVDLAYFSPDADAGAALAATMQRVSGTDGLILDLRRNGGGSGEMATALLSYFFEEPVQLSSIVEHKNGQLEERQKWTMPYVPGPRYTGKPVYILTSSHSHSAAEFCAYDLPAMRKATIIGGQTSGDANSSKGVVKLGYGFTVLIPNGQTKSPVTHTNWEGTGVQPDVAVNADDALLMAYRRALNESKPVVTDSEDLKGERLKAVQDPQAARNEGMSGSQKK